MSLRPTNVQAANGLRQTLDALEDMSIVWPSASRAKDLLQGVRLGFDASQSEASHVTRSKRHVDDAFGQEERPEYFQRDTFPPGGEAGLQQATAHNGIKGPIQRSWMYIHRCNGNTT